MIYLECYGDKSLLIGLGFSKAAFKHSRGRNNVCRAVKDNPGSFGMIDEDPGQVPDPFMTTLQTSSSTQFLKLLVHPEHGSRLVVVRPQLEQFVIKMAREFERSEGINRILQSYHLPASFRDLHDALNQQARPNQHFMRMIAELKNRSAILHSLADMLG